jgi:hypothetical protein
MSLKLIGPACINAEHCNPGKPARPVWDRDSGLCWPCHALGRVVDNVRDHNLECVICGGDPRGGEVQPVFGAGRDSEAGTGHASLPEPLMFCRACADAVRARRGETAAPVVAFPITDPDDALRRWAA